MSELDKEGTDWVFVPVDIYKEDSSGGAPVLKATIYMVKYCDVSDPPSDWLSMRYADDHRIIFGVDSDKVSGFGGGTYFFRYSIDKNDILRLNYGTAQVNNPYVYIIGQTLGPSGVCLSEYDIEKDKTSEICNDCYQYVLFNGNIYFWRIESSAKNELNNCVLIQANLDGSNQQTVKKITCSRIDLHAGYMICYSSYSDQTGTKVKF